MTLLPLLLACSAPVTSPGSDGVDSGGGQDSVGWATLHGEPISPPIPLPDFDGVRDSSGAVVGPEDLKGHATVMWFYPAAGTYG